VDDPFHPVAFRASAADEEEFSGRDAPDLSDGCEIRRMHHAVHATSDVN